MKRSRCEWDWTYPREAWPRDLCPIPYPIYGPVAGAANALTYGQFVAKEYTGIKPLGRQSSPQTQRHQRTPAPELYLRQLNSSANI